MIHWMVPSHYWNCVALMQSERLDNIIYDNSCDPHMWVVELVVFRVKWRGQNQDREIERKHATGMIRIFKEINTWNLQALGNYNQIRKITFRKLNIWMGLDKVVSSRLEYWQYTLNYYLRYRNRKCDLYWHRINIYHKRAWSTTAVDLRRVGCFTVH